MDMFILKLVFVSALVGYITWVLAGYNGLSWTLVIVLVVVAIYDFITIEDRAWPAYLRRRRQPGSGRAERHQRQED